MKLSNVSKLVCVHAEMFIITLLTFSTVFIWQNNWTIVTGVYYIFINADYIGTAWS